MKIFARKYDSVYSLSAVSFVPLHRFVPRSQTANERANTNAA